MYILQLCAVSFVTQNGSRRELGRGRGCAATPSMNLLLSLLTQVIWLQTDIASTQSTARWHFHTEFVKPLLLQSCSIGEIIPFKGHTF